MRNELELIDVKLIVLQVLGLMRNELKLTKLGLMCFRSSASCAMNLSLSRSPASCAMKSS